MSSLEKFDCIVIGAGIIGTSSAYQLAKSGKRTLLLEQHDIGHTRGSSHGGSRVCRLTQGSAVFMALAIEAYKEWAELERLSGQTLLVKNGLLWLGDKKGVELRSKLATRYGVKHEVLNNRQVTERFPHLDYNTGPEDEYWWATYEPSGGTLLADKCIKAMQENFVANGGVIRDRTTVLRIVTAEPGEPIEVYAQRARYICDVVVVAAGAWLSRLLPELSVRTTPLLVCPGFWQVRENHEHFKLEAGGRSPCIIMTAPHDELYMMPCVDYKDKIKIGLHLGVPINPDNLASVEVPEWMSSICGDHLKKHIRAIDSSAPVIKQKCIYTMCDDQNFIIDRHPSARNIIIAGGMSGTSFKFGPAIGKVVTRLAAGETVRDIDLAPFSAARVIPPFLRGKL